MNYMRQEMDKWRGYQSKVGVFISSLTQKTTNDLNSQWTLRLLHFRSVPLSVMWTCHFVLSFWSRFTIVIHLKSRLFHVLLSFCGAGCFGEPLLCFKTYLHSFGDVLGVGSFFHSLSSCLWWSLLGLGNPGLNEFFVLSDEWRQHAFVHDFRSIELGE